MEKKDIRKKKKRGSVYSPLTVSIRELTGGDSLSSMFTARGADAKANANKEKVDLSKVYYRFKAGEGAKVRVLGILDYVEYKAHSSFTYKVYTQPCVGVTGVECPLCTASKSGIEGFDELYAKKRYIFVFGDLDTGTLKAIDVSKNQAKKLIADIEEYADDINDIAFNLKRTGEKTDTTFSLNPILKLKGEDTDKFEALAGIEVTDQYFNDILLPRSYDMQVEILKEAGFPVEEYFEVKETTNETVVEETGEEIF